jgi:bifunctional UDP-N-acetylglucosamine pyrophosphorylase/glucosamine-1-phosphate N-acetyltransferase
MTSPPSFAVIVLAAGQGTRMRSDTHKVLHPIAGKPMLLHLLDTVAAMGADRQADRLVALAKKIIQGQIGVRANPGI